MNGIAYPLRVLGRASHFLASVRDRLALDRVFTPVGTVSTFIVVFVSITVWWLTQDDRVADSATANHVFVASSYHDLVRSGDLLAPFREYNIYPPVGHIVGMLGLFAGSFGQAAPIMAENLVFVPLLALGCYGTGKVAYNRWVGVLAALFALGTPMVIAHFHAFMLDVPLAAMVALTVWLLLASNRFSRLGYSAGAGAAAGLGMLTKSTFGLFIVALVVVLLLRGGWRNWKGASVFVLVGAAVAAPWYLDHLNEMTSLTGGAVGGPDVKVPRWSIRNFLWYGANAFEYQLYLPLSILVLTGLCVTARGWLRRRAADDYAPELIIGGLGGYLAMTALTLKDPRYTLPCLVFAAVLGTAWMVKSNGHLRIPAIAAMTAIVVTNSLAVDFGLGGSHGITLPGNWSNLGFLHGRLTLVAPPTYPELGRDEPGHDGVRQLLRAAREDGARQVYLHELGMDDWRSFNPNGVSLLASIVGLRGTPGNRPEFLARRDRIVIRRFREPGDPPPCLPLADGSGVYLARGGPNPYNVSFDALQIDCPPGYGGGDRLSRRR